MKRKNILTALLSLLIAPHSIKAQFLLGSIHILRNGKKKK